VIMRHTCPVCLGIVGSTDTCDDQARPGVTRYGLDVDADWYRQDIVPDLPIRCRDCGVRLTRVHHPFCCVAGCITCDGEQRFGCGCDEEYEPL
jgi:hypothetical protein